MKHYKSYMDRVTVSEELHNKLLGLEAPKKARAPWTRYAAVAACAALLVGAGVWGVGTYRQRQEDMAWKMTVGNVSGPFADYDPVPCVAPTMPAEAIDLAPVEGDDIEPGMKTIEGYEERFQSSGLDLVRYHVLPWIDYGTEDNAAGELDWDIPKGGTRRDLSMDEITALLGGEQAVDLHLDWSAYELTGWAAWYADGSFWGAYLMGYKGPMDHFEFAVTAGNLPPTCFVFGGSVEQEIWGLTVTADKYDGKDGCSRRVSFMKDGYGYRFDLTATGEPEDAERLVSRAVTWVANGDGLSLYAMTGEEEPDPAPSMPVENPAASVPPRTSASSYPGPAASVSGASPSRGPAGS